MFKFAETVIVPVVGLPVDPEERKLVLRTAQDRALERLRQQTDRQGIVFHPENVIYCEEWSSCKAPDGSDGLMGRVEVRGLRRDGRPPPTVIGQDE